MKIQTHSPTFLPVLSTSPIDYYDGGTARLNTEFYSWDTSFDLVNPCLKYSCLLVVFCVNLGTFFKCVLQLGWRLTGVRSTLTECSLNVPWMQNVVNTQVYYCDTSFGHVPRKLYSALTLVLSSSAARSWDGYPWASASTPPECSLSCSLSCSLFQGGSRTSSTAMTGRRRWPPSFTGATITTTALATRDASSPSTTSSSARPRHQYIVNSSLKII